MQCARQHRSLTIAEPPAGGLVVGGQVLVWLLCCTQCVPCALYLAAGILCRSWPRWKQ